jgi:hypothetical protein
MIIDALCWLLKWFSDIHSAWELQYWWQSRLSRLSSVIPVTARTFRDHPSPCDPCGRKPRADSHSLSRATWSMFHHVPSVVPTRPTSQKCQSHYPWNSIIIYYNYTHTYTRSLLDLSGWSFFETIPQSHITRFTELWSLFRKVNELWTISGCSRAHSA